MIVRRLGLAVVVCGVLSSSVRAQVLQHSEQPIFVAPITGVNGSTIQGSCAAFLPLFKDRLHIRCTNIQGGRTPVGVQLTELDQIFGERGLVNANFAGGSTFSQDVSNVDARVADDLLNGVLAIRFNSSAGPEGVGRFELADETRTVFPMTAVQGGNDRIGLCELSTIPSPPMLGFFCVHNVSGPSSFIFHRGTVTTRGDELFRIPFSGNAGNDVISGLMDGNESLFGVINTQSTNANILNTSNWIAGNNMPCHPGPTTLCLNGNRFRVNVDWQNSQGQSGAARPVASADESGLFHFFDSSNTELMVKVLNGCSLGGRFWVFASAATNVMFRMEVTDTQSGRTKTYTNPQGTPAQAITDTDAFATCP